MKKHSINYETCLQGIYFDFMSSLVQNQYVKSKNEDFDLYCKYFWGSDIDIIILHVSTYLLIFNEDSRSEQSKSIKYTESLKKLKNI